MSYILDALKKSQQERELGKVPNLSTGQLGAEATTGESMRWVYSAVVLAIAALTIAVLGLLFRSEQALYEETASLPLGPLSTAPGPREPEDQAIKDTAKSGRPAPGLAAPTTAEPGRLFPAAPDDAVLPTSPPLPRGAWATSPRLAAVTPPDPVWETIPLLGQMPPSFRQSVPDMNIDVHVYLDEPDRRFVFINERRYREGERLSEGPVVENIVPDGIVLRYQGQQFRLAL